MRPTRRAALPFVRRLLAAGLLALAAPALAASRVDVGGGRRLRHLRALQSIAAANGGNRAAGTPGYDASAEYVAGRLKEAGYAVRFEEFSVPFFEERSPPVLTVGDEAATAKSVRTLANSGAGQVTGKLSPVDLGLTDGAPPAASTSGCDPSDFAGFQAGAVALVRRGTCPFQVKVEAAAAAGAAGVIVMNEGVDGRTEAFSGNLSRPAPVPVVGVPFAYGRTLARAAADGTAIRLAVDARSGVRATRNVIAESAAEGPVRVVVGAHLDSVSEGPGINDNGSGSAAVLETALRLAAEPVRGRVRFAFWGAEEQGLIGSRHHVQALAEEERRSIALYVNLDMVGSRNFGRFVQGTADAPPNGPAAAGRAALVAFFRERGLPIDERFGGRRRGFGSDDSSFAAAGIPTLGLYTGAGEQKRDEQAARFGGLPGRPYDPCYHQTCDTLENIDPAVLAEMSDALTHALRAVTASPATGVEEGR